jgi:hypothetical protein
VKLDHLKDIGLELVAFLQILMSLQKNYYCYACYGSIQIAAMMHLFSFSLITISLREKRRIFTTAYHIEEEKRRDSPPGL